MNIIFVDVDGVLNTLENIKILSYIVKKYNCKVVLSSSWKLSPDSSNLNNLYNLFNKYNIDCIGSTPNIRKYYYKNIYTDIWKEDEIKVYLLRNSEIKHFCVIDDDDKPSCLNSISSYLVKIDYKDGLIMENENDIKRILLKENTYNNDCINDILLLRDILLQEDILEYEDIVFRIIPELRLEKGHLQNSEWHMYDVWEHTANAIYTYKLKYYDTDDKIIPVALLLHDIGKVTSYQDDGNIRHFKGHADESFKKARVILDRFDLEKEEKELILRLIKDHASKINIDDINLENIDYYKKLMIVKKCDASAYEIEHSKRILKNLEEEEKLIDKKLLLSK